MKFETVIAAIDLDDDLVDEVVLAASSLAKNYGAKLNIVSVWPLLSAVNPVFSTEIAASASVMTENVVDMHAEGRAESVRTLEAIRARLASDSKAHILDGEPAGAVSEFAKETSADLIVTGSHQRGFFGAMVQGSASRDLVKEAPCAVFLVTKAFAEKQAAKPQESD